MGGKPIRTLIAEDNLQNRNFLKEILLKNPGIEIIAEVEKGKSLIAKIDELDPDVAFIDIELPDIDGISAVKKVREYHPNLIVIFVTAHTERALEAFEVFPLDYIVKPYTVERIEKTVNKIRHLIPYLAEGDKRIEDAVTTSEKLYIKHGHDILFIDFDRIYFIEKENKKTKIHTMTERYETAESMNTIEQRLNPKKFVRSHKCYIINLTKIEKLQPWGSDSYLIKFNGYNQDALISRSKIKMLHDLLGID